MDRKLFTVGELSSITGISKQAIRYYHKIGLLKPEKIDENNNYRLYEPIHILYTNSIIQLSQLGFSLKEIKCYLSRNNLLNVQDILKIRLKITDSKIAEMQHNRKTIKTKMQAISTGYKNMEKTGIYFKKLPERKMVYYSMNAELEKRTVIIMVNKLLQELANHKIIPGTSPVLSQKVGTDNSALEVGFLYSGDPGCGKFSQKKLLKGLYAYTFHRGPYTGIPETNKRLQLYLEKEKLKPLSETYQLFIIDYPLVQDEKDLFTEIQVRVE
jgi:Predicted transcriptional regulators